MNIYQKLKSLFFKKNKGINEFIYPMFLLLLTILLIYFTTTNQLLMSAAIEIDDSLMSSTLASASINVKNENKMDTATLKALEKSYIIFENSLKENLSLGHDMTSLPNSSYKFIIDGKIVVEEYILYKVHQGNIYISAKNVGPNVTIKGIGDVFSPRGDLITADAIYSKISFNIKVPGMNFSKKIYKECLVDIYTKS